MADTFDVLTTGRLAADLYANEIGVPLADVKTFSIYVGGSPANVAVGSRRLGLNVAIASRVGVGGLSDGLLKFLESEGISTRYVTRDAEHHTGLAFLSILPPDTFPLVYYRPDPADLHLNKGDIADAPVEQSRILFLAGTNFSADPSRTAMLAALERAREAQTRTVLDLDLRPTLWPDAASYGLMLRRALPLVDIAIGTEEEIIATAGTATIEEAVTLIRSAVSEAVVVKRGQDGAQVYTVQGDTHEAAPFTVEVLNVLGAGDAWASGFIYGLLQGWDWATCARFGNATGAIIVTRHACANDMPTLEEVHSFIDEQGGL
jgi:5-dehydro-2-deoxygluconokinase